MITESSTDYISQHNSLSLSPFPLKNHGTFHGLFLGGAVRLTRGSHLPQRLEVIPSALLDPDVRVDGRVPSRTRQVFVVAVRDVLVCPWVAVLLRQTWETEQHTEGNTC